MRHQNACTGAGWSNFCQLGGLGQWGHVCHRPCCRVGGGCCLRLLGQTSCCWCWSLFVFMRAKEEVVAKQECQCHLGGQR
jgi:hypothetical protein